MRDRDKETHIWLVDVKINGNRPIKFLIKINKNRDKKIISIPGINDFVKTLNSKKILFSKIL